MRIPELLVPASSLEVLKTAVIFGADAVYIGGEVFSLRAKSKNFSLEDMKEGIDFAHAHGVKVYVTSNILAHNQDLEGVREYFKELKVIQPDALIISDPGVFDIAREIVPEIDVHISTQANNTNYGTYNFWYRQGARRVVTENYQWRRLLISESISRMIWRLKPLSMAQCVSLIPADACSAIISLEEMPIRAHVPIHADGNMRSWKSPDLGNIFRCMRMKEALIFLTRKIYA